MKEILYLCSVFIKLVYRMDAKKILFIAQEITPYLPESEIATICRNLPQGIQERGREIRTFMPKFGSINERRNQLHEVIRLSGMNLIIDDTDHPLIIKVASIQAARMQVYFIDNEDFFQRKHTINDDDGNEYEDNDDFKTPFRKEFASKLKMDGAKDSDLKGIKTDTSFTGLTKLAIDFADGVIQGSETINQDVLDYIATKKHTPFLPYQSSDVYMDKFNEFYDVILGTK